MKISATIPVGKLVERGMFIEGRSRISIRKAANKKGSLHRIIETNKSVATGHGRRREAAGFSGGNAVQTSCRAISFIPGQHTSLFQAWRTVPVIGRLACDSIGARRSAV